MLDDTQLAERLRGTELMSDQEVEQARVLQDREDRPLYDVLLAHNFIEEPALVDIASDMLNVSAVNLQDVELDRDLAELLPKDVALRNWTLPLEKEVADGTDRLVLAMRDPIDMMAMDEVADYTDIDIRPVLAGPQALRAAFEDIYGPIDEFPERESDTDGDEGAFQTRNKTRVGPITASVSEEDADEIVESALESEPPPEPVSDNPAQPSEDDSSPSNGEGAQLGRIAIEQVPASDLEDPSGGMGEHETEAYSESDASELVAESAGEDSTEDKPDDGESDPLSSLRKRLGRENSTLSSPSEGEIGSASSTPSETFIERFVERAGGLDDDDRRLLEQVTHQQLVEAVVLTLVSDGAIDIRELVAILEKTN